MTALLALWLCGVCVLSAVALYYGMPPTGTRPNLYEVMLGMLSGTALAVSATITVVSLFSPLLIQPGW